MNKELIIDYLATLTDLEFVEVFYRSSQGRRKEQKYEDGDYQIECAMALALCSYGSYEGKADDCAEIELCSFPKDFSSDFGTNMGFYEQGECEQCRTPLISVAKKSVCPICHSEVFLT